MDDNMRVIFSHTWPDLDYPPFLRIEADNDGTIFVTMRGPCTRKISEVNGYYVPGDVTTLRLPYEAFRKMETGVHEYGLEAMVKWLEDRSA